MFGFERLEVWHKAVEYAGTIYDVTRTFPEDERFGLTSQLRRSSVSISSNIAEGSSRSSRVDFNRFIEIAYGSLLESVSELRIAQKQKFISDTSFRKDLQGGRRISQNVERTSPHYQTERQELSPSTLTLNPHRTLNPRLSTQTKAMSTTVIRVENLSKQYRIGKREGAIPHSPRNFDRFCDCVAESSCFDVSTLRCPVVPTATTRYGL